MKLSKKLIVILVPLAVVTPAPGFRTCQALAANRTSGGKTVSASLTIAPINRVQGESLLRENSPIEIPALNFSMGMDSVFQARTLPDFAKALEQAAADAKDAPERLAPLAAIMAAALDASESRRTAALANLLAGAEGNSAVIAAVKLQAAVRQNKGRSVRALETIRGIHRRLQSNQAVAALAQAFDATQGRSEIAIFTRTAASPPARSASLADELLTEKRRGKSLDPLGVNIPKDILQRTTRLQFLLEKKSLDKLAASDKDPRVQELVSESKKTRIAWRDFPGQAEDALSYVEYFTLDDLIYMAADERYAKKIAGDLRTYANIKMGGATRMFRNDTLYWAARVLVDRWRIKEEGFPMITNDAQWKIEARKAGVEAQTKTILYLISALPPENVHAIGAVRNAPGPRTASILETHSKLYGDHDEANFLSSFLDLHDRGEAPDGVIRVSAKEAKTILVRHLEAEQDHQDHDDYGASEVIESARYFGESIDRIIIKITGAETGFQYEVEKQTVIKPGTLNQSWITYGVTAAKIKRYRRFYGIAYDFKSHRDSFGENRRGHTIISDEWQDFDSPAAPKKAALSMSPMKSALTGKTFVFTGELPSLTRTQAGDMLQALGGKVSRAVSRYTDYVVVGKAPGSKLDNARMRGIPQLSEREFLDLIRETETNAHPRSQKLNYPKASSPKT